MGRGLEEEMERGAGVVEGGEGRGGGECKMRTRAQEQGRTENGRNCVRWKSGRGG